MRPDCRGASLFLAFAFVFQILGRHGSGDHVFLAGPITKIDDLAALTTEGEERVVGRNIFLANGALHHLLAPPLRSRFGRKRTSSTAPRPGWGNCRPP